MDSIKKLKEAIIASEQDSIFQSITTEREVMEACVSYLKYNGYTVVAPKNFSADIKDLKSLVNYFYLLLNSETPENYMYSCNLNKDLGIARRFVEARMVATGANKQYVLNECGEIIRTVINNKDIFNFKYNINFSLFGQSNMKWVTDKALDIMNKKLKEKNEKEGEKLRECAIEAQDMSDLGFDLDSILEKMEEVEDGKEEED